MSVRTFAKIVAVFALALAGWVFFLLLHQWNEQTIGTYRVRHNALTGAVQMRVGDDWKPSFDATDPYAPAVAPADLRRIRFLDPTWGSNGLLCARALIAPGPPIKGRMIIALNITDVAWKKQIRERDLRQNVNWSGGALTPFVVKTGLSAPTEKNQKTFLTPQAALSGGD